MSAPAEYRVEVAPGVFRTEQAAVTPREHNDAVADQLQHQTIGDLTDELLEAGAELTAALLQGDAQCIGEIVLAVRQAYAVRCADFGLYGFTSAPSAQDAAAAVLLQRAHEKAAPRRFLSEPHHPSAFGELRA